MPSCTLEIAERLVARAEGGAFETEYALFDAHEIDLASNNEPGTVREQGYRTTVELARERLDTAGITRALADGVAEELGALTATYALGTEVRRVAMKLGPGELFATRAFDSKARIYQGVWLDLSALAADTGLDHAARALQALYLAALLSETPGDAPIVMRTFEWMRERRAGERSHRRISLAAGERLPDAIRALADRGAPARAARENDPTRMELLEWTRERRAACASEGALERLDALERQLAVRERPARGPLADAELWAIELTLGEGKAEDAVAPLDAFERARGRQPGTAYLRARVALMLGHEEPGALAERVSALAMSMNAFPELELLAAEAWQRAGDRKRALAHARNLAEDRQVDGYVRALAQAIARPTADEPPSSRRSMPPSGGNAAPPSTAHATSARRASIAAGAAPARAEGELDKDPFSKVPPALASAAAVGEEIAIRPAPILSIEPPGGGPSGAPALAAPADADAGLSGLAAAARAAQAAIDGPPSSIAVPSASLGGVPLADVLPRSKTSPGVGVSKTSPGVGGARPPPPLDGGEDDETPTAMRGGSLPPFRTEPPPEDFPITPLVPRDDAKVERAASLALPPGVTEGPFDPHVLPATPLAARVYFTMQTRELAQRYKTSFGVELRMDVRGLEILQRNLAERFPTGAIASNEDIDEVRRHGAFLAEMLARRLGAEWTDTAVSEMGYWAMNVPPGTTVWPVGRVVRFVTMRHRERDLVSYFLELQTRAHGIR